jgi:lipoprotein-anchoring transpeptidase ErfK/SrfK
VFFLKRIIRLTLWLLLMAALAGACLWLWRETGREHAKPQAAGTPLPPPAATPVPPPAPVPPVVSPTNPPPVVILRVAKTQPATNGVTLSASNRPALRPPRSPAPPPLVSSAPGAYPRPAQTLFEAQLALARQGISCGSVDGLIGPQTRAALTAFQEKEHLPVTGQFDASTREHLRLENPPLVTYTVSSNDLARLQPLSATWLGKSRQTALEYETLLELLAEIGQANPRLIRQLNPDVNWTNLSAGAMVSLPDVACREGAPKAAFLTISLDQKNLRAFDANSNLLAYFPCSIAQRVEKRPVGELHVATVAPDPNYTFDPEVFPESPEARELRTKLLLPPGPNNPVGVVWIGLDRPGYGIHGTPSPEQIGRTESHGCFRLANWNARRLLTLVSVGTPVLVQ